MNANVLGHLSAVDPVLGAIIDKVGPCALQPDQRSPYEGLVRAVAHQQLNDKAASTILARFLALFPNRGFPGPQQLADIKFERLLTAGFSKAKARYIQGIARGALDGTLPNPQAIEAMTDDQIVERLTQLPGIGRWSAEMFLIFGLGRPDVLPVQDFGIRTGFALVYRKRKLPTPEQILKFGERWKPHRTTASWYLWRAVELLRK